MNRWSFVSREFWSNCLIEALKAKVKNSHVHIYICKPHITKCGEFQMPHFMWSDGTADFDFSNKPDGYLPWYKCLWFKGAIRKFEPGFAKWYSERRNRKERL